MFSSKNEEFMIKALIQKNKEDLEEELTFIFDDGSKYSGVINSFYETDNGLEMDEEGYLEYYACAVSIKTIHVNNSQSIQFIKKGTIQELGGNNIPRAILSSDGTTLWSNN
ncbi:MAG: hypothetical protein N4A63_09670 [Vallitalea sp.]|jgi:hypothetical protein|nr:hypothetical protein [Vallitalea sp.]MCT4597688.1 hypothetical protein [Vallitalea sp.]